MAAIGNDSLLVAPVLLRSRNFQWYWNSAAHGADEQWQKYRDIENEIIEDAWNQKKLNVEIDGDYMVSFEQQAHYRKDNSREQHRIKRDTFNRDHTVDNIRAERYLLPVTFTNDISTVSSQAQQQDRDLAELRLYGYFPATYSNLELLAKNKTIADIVEEAAQGIINEGTAHGKVHEARWLAKTLRDVQHSGVNVSAQSFKIPLDIGQTCIYLYTKDSFWYKLINYTLCNPKTIVRNQIKTLGPFCYLLDRFLVKQVTDNVDRVYCSLNSDHEKRKQFMKKWIKFTSFTPTSSDREVAELFSGNTLCIIDLAVSSGNIQHKARCGACVSPFSDFPEEQEFVLWPGAKFRFVKQEYDTAKNKNIIYLGHEYPVQQQHTTLDMTRPSSGRWPFDWDW